MDERSIRIFDDLTQPIGDTYLAVLRVSDDQLAVRGVRLYMPPPDEPQWFDAGPTVGQAIELASGRRYIMYRHVGLDTVTVVGRDAVDVAGQVAVLLDVFGLDQSAIEWIQEEGAT
jgi:hypothetical protein